MARKTLLIVYETHPLRQPGIAAPDLVLLGVHGSAQSAQVEDPSARRRRLQARAVQALLAAARRGRYPRHEPPRGKEDPCP